MFVRGHEEETQGRNTATSVSRRDSHDPALRSPYGSRQGFRILPFQRQRFAGRHETRRRWYPELLARGTPGTAVAQFRVRGAAREKRVQVVPAQAVPSPVQTGAVVHAM